jgi:hypothetical protein
MSGTKEEERAEPTPETDKRVCRKEHIHSILKHQFDVKYRIDIDNRSHFKIHKEEIKELKHILKWFRINKKIIIELKFVMEWKKHYLPKIQKILAAPSPSPSPSPSP